MMKIISLVFFSLLLSHFTQAANMDKLSNKYHQELSQLADPNTSELQRRRAEKAIVKLACKGEINAFKMLRYFAPNKDKSLFIRDFLARPLSKRALKNTGSYIAKKNKKSRNFLPRLRRLIAEVDRSQVMKARLEKALKLKLIPNELEL